MSEKTVHKCQCGAIIADGTCGACWPSECSCKAVSFQQLITVIKTVSEERAFKASVKRGNRPEIVQHITDALSEYWFGEEF